jgi:hypothetical protein
MKTIIAGSREIQDYASVLSAIESSQFAISEVVCGMARGVDSLGMRWAIENKKPYKAFPADWNGLGKKAGYLRNVDMANYAEALIAVWDGKSRGTNHMIDIARAKSLKVFIYEVQQRR